MFFFFINDTAPTEIYTYLHTRSLLDSLPISGRVARQASLFDQHDAFPAELGFSHRSGTHAGEGRIHLLRSTGEPADATSFRTQAKDVREEGLWCRRRCRGSRWLRGPDQWRADGSHDTVHEGRRAADAWRDRGGSQGVLFRGNAAHGRLRSEEHTSELQSLMRN